MRSLTEDLRGALRTLRSRPGYTVVSVITLALGIAATTAVFSVVDALLFRPLPYPNPSRVVRLRVAGDQNSSRFRLDAWRALQQQHAIFDGVEAFVFGTQVIVGNGEPTIVQVTQVSDQAFQMLGVAPLYGRLFVEDDSSANQGRVLIISHRFWSERFGRDPGVIGRTISLDDVPYEVVGVMPQSFRFPYLAVRAWRPYVGPPAVSGRAPRVELIARVRATIPLDQAQRDLRALSSSLQEARVLAPYAVLQIAPFETITRTERAPLLVLLGAVFLVLGVACANVMNLALANGATRQREFAIRTALGASRVSLVRQLLVEAGIIGAVGGIAGAWLAYIAIESLAPLIPNELVFLSLHTIRVDSRVLVVTTGFTLISTLIAGVLPALRGSRAGVSNGLKADGRPQTASSRQRRLLASMAVTQCALAIVLLAGAGLLVRSFLKLQAVDPGFDTENLLVMGVSPRQSGGTRYSDAPRQVAFFDRLEAELRALPGVRAVLVAAGAPPQGGAVRAAELETDAAPGETRAMVVPFTAVTPTYFSVMGIRMLAGQIFASTDPVTTVVIDEDFAKRFWGSAHAAVGRRFRMAADEEWHTVVGVAADVKMMGLDDGIGEGLQYYHPLQRSGEGWPAYALIVRTVGNPDALIPTVKQRIWAIDPKLPIHNASDIHERLAESISRQRFFLTLMVLFASIATVIAAIGIYAVFAYSVAQRTHELGVRLAVGATSAQIGRLVLNEAIALAVAGAFVGLSGAWMLSRTLESLLFHVTPTDPAALTAAALVLVLLAIVACYVPARRAMRVDPLIMLKVE